MTCLARSAATLFAAVVLAFTPPLSAQPAIGRAESMSTNVQAAFYHVRPGTASVRVQVLGAARAPGLYEVSEGTDLGQVLALAGGPILGSSPSGTRATAGVRLYRPGGDGQEVAFEAPLERLAASASSPVLLDGDVLLVEVTGGRIESADTNASAYYYVRPETASVRVQVLGAVHAPGLYEVSEGLGLGDVLALAGGPAVGSERDGTRTTVTLRLHRPTASGQEVIYEGPFEPEPGSARPPAVRDGDVLVTEIQSARRFGWRDVVQIVSAVGVVALAIDRLSSAGN